MGGASIASLLALLVANFVPLAGVTVLGWNLATVVVLYWVENGIVGLFNLPKIALASRAVLATDFDSRAPPTALPQLSWMRSSFGRGLLMVVFAAHFGAFWAGHGFLVMTLLRLGQRTEGSTGHLIGSAVASGAIGLLGSHAVSFVTNYVGRREYRSVSPLQQSSAPYRREVLLYVVIMAGAFGLVLLRTPLYLLAVLVVGKIALDAHAHLAEHRAVSRRERPPRQKTHLLEADQCSRIRRR